MTMCEMEDTNLVNGDTCGLTAQLDQTIEEAAELIQALTKLKRHRKTRYEDSERMEALRWRCVEEIADMELMIAQLKWMLEIPDEALSRIKKYKVKRTACRIAKTGANIPLDEEF